MAANPSRRTPEFWENERFNDPRQPVVGVNWSDAQAYCDWAGLALPSEARWEAAARGTDGRPYPWGPESPTVDHADFDKDWQKGKPDPAGSHPNGAGPYGAEDQAGTVWEWCADAWDEHAYRDRDGQRDPVVKPRDEGAEAAVRVVRGGSWALPSWGLRAAFRLGDGAGIRGLGLGFRVCLSVPEP